jgi:TDG/mug DNA glycosylase family protein
MPRANSRHLPEHLPLLTDRIKPGVQVLFVGINPGIRSSQTGHHFAGFSNRFWKLVSESGLVPAPITYLDDDRLPEWGLGITNLVARPTPGVNDLAPAEYAAGRAALERKIRRFKPPIVALIGVSLARALLPATARAPLEVGLHPETLAGAPVFVLPNPSGRNAHFSYADMLEAFTSLKRYVDAASRRRARSEGVAKRGT